MAKNVIQQGHDRVDVIVTSAPSVSGAAAFKGDFFGVYLSSEAVGEKVSLLIRGIVSLPKKSGVALAEGDSVGFDVSANEVVTDIDVNSDGRIGVVSKAAAGGDAEVEFMLNHPTIA